MTSLRRGDADLHHEDGSHWTTARTANGRDLENHERRIIIHLAEHEEREVREQTGECIVGPDHDVVDGVCTFCGAEGF